MIYLKTFENVTNYKVEVLTSDEFSDLYTKLYPFNYDSDKQFNLKDKIEYFNYNDIGRSWSNEIYDKTLRLITAYNDKDILGICHFAYYDLSKHYAVSYLSTNNDYFQKGISKRLLEELFKYFSETYPNETLNWSGYSVKGWKYLHPTILEMSKKYNVKIVEKGIEYIKGKWTDEDRDLFDKSREEITKIYGHDEYPF
jgi:hypothetical protein